MRLVPRIGLLVVAAVLAAGCAHAPARAPALAASARTAVALLPLENFSERAEYADRMTRVVWSAIGRDGRFEAIEPGEVDAVMADLRIRSSGVLTRDQIVKAAEKLGVRWILAGAVIECGTVRTPDGDVPSLSMSLRLLDGRSGRVAWTDLRAHSGEDRETVFGWGRETSIERLANRTAVELIAAMRLPAEPDSAAQGGHR